MFPPCIFMLFSNDKEKTNHAQSGHKVDHSVAHCGLARLRGHWFEWDMLSVDLNRSHFAGDLIHFTQASFQESRTTYDWRVRSIAETSTAFYAWLDERATCWAVIGTSKWFSNWVILAGCPEKLSKFTKTIHQSCYFSVINTSYASYMWWFIR